MPILLKIVGFILLAMHGLWFFATSMTEAYKVDGTKDNGMMFVRKWLLVTFAVTGIWIGIVLAMVVF